MTAETGRDGEIHGRGQRLLPRQHGHPDGREQLVDARHERGRSGAGREQLHALVAVEEAEHVEQPGRGGDVVHDEEHGAAVAARHPASGVGSDGHPYPRVPALTHPLPPPVPAS
ncbi:hypothetical protein ACIBI4_06930 [Streptomyces sp. NPDC050418]|uniref:hypothetical protein n=1 Tax=Streptomyces sp. NPDC050418 TaxID=3365612 RepID=UPI0037885878